jgi:hypothetical protein
MKALSTGIGLQLHWIQPSVLERHFELYSENCLLGELRFEPGGRTAYGTLTIASSATKRWTFRVTGGILKPRVTIRETGTNNDLAVYWYKRWGGGWVEFVNGSKFYWKPTSFWGTEKGFYNGNKELLFDLKQKFFALLKMRHAVKLETRCNALDELPLLLVLAGYLCAVDSFAS